MRAAVLLALVGGSAAFTTTLHGGADEATPVGAPGAATLQLQPWLTNYDPDAVCNDGTPAGYFFQKGWGSGANVWVAYLEGGYWCWDKESCDLRYNTTHFQMSSADWAPLFAQEGIFSTDSSNPFYNANLAWVKYCSSDSWFGDAGASPATFGYNFRGSRIVSATVTALMQHNGMGSQPGAKFLLAGCSAGGRGVMGNIDSVASMLPNDIQFSGLIDAAAWVDIDPPSWIPGLQSLQSMTQEVYAFSNPPIPSDCEQAYQGEEWKCIWSSYRLPFVQTPYLLNAAQFDAFMMMYNMDNKAPSGTAQYAYVEQFQVETLALFNELNPQKVAIQSSACQVHCLSGNADFTGFTVDGVSLAQAVAVWFFGGDASYRNIEPCTGFDCTFQCQGGPWQPSNVQCSGQCGIMGALPEQSIQEAQSFYSEFQQQQQEENQGQGPQQQVQPREGSFSGAQSQNMQNFVQNQQDQQQNNNNNNNNNNWHNNWQ